MATKKNMNANLELLTGTLQFVDIFDDSHCWSTGHAPSLKALLCQVQERIAVDLLNFQEIEVVRANM